MNLHCISTAEQKKSIATGFGIVPWGDYTLVVRDTPEQGVGCNERQFESMNGDDLL